MKLVREPSNKLLRSCRIVFGAIAKYTDSLKTRHNAEQFLKIIEGKAPITDPHLYSLRETWNPEDALLILAGIQPYQLPHFVKSPELLINELKLDITDPLINILMAQDGFESLIQKRVTFYSNFHSKYTKFGHHVKRHDGLCLSDVLELQQELNMFKNIEIWQDLNKPENNEILQELSALNNKQIWREDETPRTLFEELGNHVVLEIKANLYYALQLARVWDGGKHPERPEPAYFFNWLRHNLPASAIIDDIEKCFLTKKSKDVKHTRQNPLSWFQALDELAFKDITMKYDPDARALRVDARGKQTTISLSDLGLTKAGGIALNRQGKAFFDIQNQIFNTEEAGADRALKRLSSTLRKAFDTSDTPYVKGRPQFKLIIPKEIEAKRKAEERTSSFDEKKPAHSNADAFLQDNDPNYDPSNAMYSDDTDP